MKRIRQRQLAFLEHVLRKHDLENLVATGRIEGRELGAVETKASGWITCMYRGRTTWAQHSSSLLRKTERVLWHRMVANVVNNGTAPWQQHVCVLLRESAIFNHLAIDDHWSHNNGVASLAHVSVSAITRSQIAFRHESQSLKQRYSNSQVPQPSSVASWQEFGAIRPLNFSLFGKFSLLENCRPRMLDLTRLFQLSKAESTKLTFRPPICPASEICRVLYVGKL